MGGSFSGLGIHPLALFADRPARPEQSRIRMWRSFQDRRDATYFTRSFGQQRLDGGAVDKEYFFAVVCEWAGISPPGATLWVRECSKILSRRSSGRRVTPGRNRCQGSSE
jgi:hypothetical protein